MLATILPFTFVPAIVAALVITLIPSSVLGKMGKPLSLIATGLLLTLALTHLIPEAVESASEPFHIGIAIWIAIMVLIGLEMFFNSQHTKETCPVCASKEESAKAPRFYQERNKEHSGDIKINAINTIKAPLNISKTTIVAREATLMSNQSGAQGLNASGSNAGAGASLNLSSNANASHQSSMHAPYEHGHHGHSHGSAQGEALEIHGENHSPFHHMGHSHDFNINTDDIERAKARAKHGGSFKHGLANGGAAILTGSFFHSLCDGVVIASSFLADFRVGMAVTAAIVAHELPAQLSNYVLMLNFGMNRIQGYVVNLVALLGSLIGASLFYVLVNESQAILPYALAVAAGSFIYVALSDILPRVSKQGSKKSMLYRFGYIVFGALLAFVLVDHEHNHGPEGHAGHAHIHAGHSHAHDNNHIDTNSEGYHDIYDYSFADPTTGKHYSPYADHDHADKTHDHDHDHADEAHDLAAHDHDHEAADAYHEHVEDGHNHSADEHTHDYDLNVDTDDHDHSHDDDHVH